MRQRGRASKKKKKKEKTHLQRVTAGSVRNCNSLPLRDRRSGRAAVAFRANPVRDHARSDRRSADRDCWRRRSACRIDLQHATIRPQICARTRLHQAFVDRDHRPGDGAGTAPQRPSAPSSARPNRNLTPRACEDVVEVPPLGNFQLVDVSMRQRVATSRCSIGWSAGVYRRRGPQCATGDREGLRLGRRPRACPFRD